MQDLTEKSCIRKKKKEIKQNFVLRSFFEKIKFKNFLSHSQIF